MPVMSLPKCLTCRFCSEHERWNGLTLHCKVTREELLVEKCPMEPVLEEKVVEEGVVPATEKKKRGRKPSITTDGVSAKPKGRVVSKPRSTNLLPVM